MSIIYDFLETYLGGIDKSYDVATEADDITGGVKQEASNMNGGEKEDSNEISLNTDHIFGDDNSESNSSSGNSDNGESAGEDSSGEDPDDLRENDSGGDDEGENGDDEEMVDDEEGNDSEGDSSEIVQKNSLKKELQHLYTVFDSDIQLLADYIPNITSPDGENNLSSIKKNLTDAKKFTHDILKDEFKDLPYPILKKKHIALRQVHDLCMHAIEKNFENTRDKK